MKYRLASDAADYTLCHALMGDEDMPYHPIDYPTVMALDDDGELVGFLATTPDDDLVLAGPLVLRHDKRRPMTAVRMIELYRISMRATGVTRVVLSTERDGFIDKGIDRFLPYVTPYAEDDKNKFYVWPLDMEA